MPPAFHEVIVRVLCCESRRLKCQQYCSKPLLQRRRLDVTDYAVCEIRRREGTSIASRPHRQAD
jgi:hypothetical protein